MADFGNYDPTAAAQGTGRGALTHRLLPDGTSEIGYYGNGQWNSMGPMPAAGTPEWMQFVQQASPENRIEEDMQAQQLQAFQGGANVSPFMTQPYQPQTQAAQQAMQPQQAQRPVVQPTMYGAAGGASNPFQFAGGNNGGYGGLLQANTGSVASPQAMGSTPTPAAGGTSTAGGVPNPFQFSDFFRNYWGK